MPGIKGFLERCCDVKFGPHSFKTGIPRILIPGCVLLFVAIFFIVMGILLCGIHAAYEVSKVNDTYEDWFLISGIIALVLGFIIALVGSVWCCHVKRHLQDELDYYHDTKLSRSASIRSNISQAGLPSVSNGDNMHPMSTSSSQHHSYRPPHSTSSAHHPSYEQQQSFEPQDVYYPRDVKISHQSVGGETAYDPVTDSYVPRESLGYHPGHTGGTLPRNRDPDAVTKINNKIDKGVRGIQDFVERNTNGDSPRRKKAPYSDRMQSSSSGYPEQQQPGYPDGYGHDNSGGDQFDLANKYKPSQPQPHFPPAQHPSPREHDDGGYANIPDTYNALPKSNHHQPDPEESMEEESPQVIAPAPPKNKNSRYNNNKYKNPPMDASINSSIDSNTAPDDKKTTLVYNPKDGQWYYYHKGRPVSMYTGDNPERDSKRPGPSYKYIKGKPVLVNSSVENLAEIGATNGGKHKKGTNV